MKKIKITIISIFIFFIVFIISDFLLKKIPPTYYSYGCFPSLPGGICRMPPLGAVMPFILGLGVAIWYFYRSLSSIRSNQKVKKLIP